MKRWRFPVLVLVLATVVACGRGDDESGESPVAGPETPPATGTREPATAGGADAVEIEPGLTARVLEPGSGEPAQPGQTAVVHYTGWLHDPAAPGNRGQKFDSSLDRGQHFRFSIGAGSVIRGWDRGVAGMQVGEVRELTIAPELAYGERGAGGVIPPDATLVFEVELAELENGAAE